MEPEDLRKEKRENHEGTKTRRKEEESFVVDVQQANGLGKLIRCRGRNVLRVFVSSCLRVFVVKNPFFLVK